MTFLIIQIMSRIITNALKNIISCVGCDKFSVPKSEYRNFYNSAEHTDI